MFRWPQVAVCLLLAGLVGEGSMTVPGVFAREVRAVVCGVVSFKGVGLFGSFCRRSPCRVIAFPVIARLRRCCMQMLRSIRGGPVCRSVGVSVVNGSRIAG